MSAPRAAAAGRLLRLGAFAALGLLAVKGAALADDCTREYIYAGSRPITVTTTCAPTQTRTVGFSVSSSSVYESAGSVSVVVVVTTSNGVPTTTAVSVDYTTTPGTAQPPGDYTTTSGTLNFGSGTPSGTTQTIVVPIINDATYESGASETFTVNLSNAVGATLGPATHTVTIVDDDFYVPAQLRATTSSATAIQINWGTVAGTAHYELQKSANYAQSGTFPYDHGFSTIALPTAPPFSDTVPAGAAYIYRIRAIDSGGNFSPFSNIDLATATSFTEDPVATGMTVKATHLTELRTAVNSARTAAGLTPPFTGWTDSSPLGVIIKKAHVQEIRDRLNDAWTALSLPLPNYTDSTITIGTTYVKWQHFQEPRQLLKGYCTATGCP